MAGRRPGDQYVEPARQQNRKEVHPARARGNRCRRPVPTKLPPTAAGLFRSSSAPARLRFGDRPPPHPGPSIPRHRPQGGGSPRIFGRIEPRLPTLARWSGDRSSPPAAPPRCSRAPAGGAAARGRPPDRPRVPDWRSLPTRAPSPGPRRGASDSTRLRSWTSSMPSMPSMPSTRSTRDRAGPIAPRLRARQQPPTARPDGPPDPISRRSAGRSRRRYKGQERREAPRAYARAYALGSSGLPQGHWLRAGYNAVPWMAPPLSRFRHPAAARSMA